MNRTIWPTFNKEVDDEALSNFFLKDLSTVIQTTPTSDGGKLERHYCFCAIVNNRYVNGYYIVGESIEDLGIQKMTELDPKVVETVRKKLLSLGGQPLPSPFKNKKGHLM